MTSSQLVIGCFCFFATLQLRVFWASVLAIEEATVQMLKWLLILSLITLIFLSFSSPSFLNYL
jgi:hypothetical protein